MRRLSVSSRMVIRDGESFYMKMIVLLGDQSSLEAYLYSAYRRQGNAMDLVLRNLLSRSM